MAAPRAAIILRRSHHLRRDGRKFWRGSVIYRDGRVFCPSWFVGDSRDALIAVLEGAL